MGTSGSRPGRPQVRGPGAHPRRHVPLRGEILVLPVSAGNYFNSAFIIVADKHSEYYLKRVWLVIGISLALVRGLF